MRKSPLVGVFEALGFGVAVGFGGVLLAELFLFPEGAGRPLFAAGFELEISLLPVFELAAVFDLFEVTSLVV